MFVEILDFLVDRFLPAFFVKFNSWMIAPGVSVLGFSIAVTILVIVIGAILLRV